MNTYEEYILKLLKRKKLELEDLLKLPAFDTNTGKDIFIPFSAANKAWPYWDKFYNLNGQIDILYMLLTGHDNKYEELKEEAKTKKKK